jgi:hypothetical protein
MSHEDKIARARVFRGCCWGLFALFRSFEGKGNSNMIPFFFSTEQIRTGVLIFGPDGRVKKFVWDTPPE